MPSQNAALPQKRAAKTGTAASGTLISLAEGAAYYDCSIRTLRRMISRGDLNGYRVGEKLLRVNRDELAQAMRVVPTAGSAA